MVPNEAGNLFCPTNEKPADILGRTDLHSDILFVILHYRFPDFPTPGFPHSWIPRFKAVSCGRSWLWLAAARGGAASTPEGTILCACAEIFAMAWHAKHTICLQNKQGAAFAAFYLEARHGICLQNSHSCHAMTKLYARLRPCPKCQWLFFVGDKCVGDCCFCICVLGVGRSFGNGPEQNCFALCQYKPISCHIDALQTKL